MDLKSRLTVLVSLGFLGSIDSFASIEKVEGFFVFCFLLFVFCCVTLSRVRKFEENRLYINFQLQTPFPLKGIGL